MDKQVNTASGGHSEKMTGEKNKEYNVYKKTTRLSSYKKLKASML